ncbi:MAG: DUF2237 family protein [Bdellovibrionales bacterium]|nr:DUF2237 family protein [Bdellovibrionales bacterium]
MKAFLGFFALNFALSFVSIAADSNVLGSKMEKCGDSPKTGFYRDGFCLTGPEDHGTHVACATVTKEFLEFTKSKGNDLITPAPEWNFPGLKPGDKWCLCALRWREAMKAGLAPKLDLKATHSKILKYAPLKELKD